MARRREKKEDHDDGSAMVVPEVWGWKFNLVSGHLHKAAPQEYAPALKALGQEWGAVFGITTEVGSAGGLRITEAEAGRRPPSRRWWPRLLRRFGVHGSCGFRNRSAFPAVENWRSIRREAESRLRALSATAATSDDESPLTAAPKNNEKEPHENAGDLDRQKKKPPFLLESAWSDVSLWFGGLSSVFHAHFDYEEAFAVQLSGRKTYVLLSVQTWKP